jgi:hypothetical protein
MYTMLDLLKSLGKMSLMIFVPVSINFSLHYFCDYLGCNHWTNLFGHNLACNACIDSKKIIKDHQIGIYWSIGTMFLNKLNDVVKDNKTLLKNDKID